MTIRRFLSLLILLAVIFFPGVSYSDTPPEISLGKDSDGLRWYLIDYGRDSEGILYAVFRIYYTNEAIRAETIDYLTSTCRVPYEDARDLDFTEYDCEYTEDGIEYALLGAYHYDSRGYEIYRTVYDRIRYEYVERGSFIEDGYEYARAESSRSSRRTRGTSSRSSGGGCNSGLASLAGLLAGLAFLRKK